MTWQRQALKKNVYIDGTLIGESSNKVFFYKTFAPGTHKLSTESEFSENYTELKTEGGKNYFVEQSIKMGVFVGGAVEFQFLAPHGSQVEYFQIFLDYENIFAEKIKKIFIPPPDAF
ncbi:MAG: DUF2846 domain-containing protein [Gammaproteobacteria bacterium]|nr:MAG: DUF2846 domain-containing protein [Gammaproteobacteria bacterium]